MKDKCCLNNIILQHKHLIWFQFPWLPSLHGKHGSLSIESGIFNGMHFGPGEVNAKK